MMQEKRLKELLEKWCMYTMFVPKEKEKECPEMETIARNVEDILSKLGDSVNEITTDEEKSIIREIKEYYSAQ